MFHQCGAARVIPGSLGEDVAGILQGGALSETIYSFVQITRFPSAWPSVYQVMQLGSRTHSEPGPQRDSCVWGH